MSTILNREAHEFLRVGRAPSKIRRGRSGVGSALGVNLPIRPLSAICVRSEAGWRWGRLTRPQRPRQALRARSIGRVRQDHRRTGGRAGLAFPAGRRPGSKLLRFSLYDSPDRCGTGSRHSKALRSDLIKMKADNRRTYQRRPNVVRGCIRSTTPALAPRRFEDAVKVSGFTA